MIPLDERPGRLKPFAQSATEATVVVVALSDQMKLPETLDAAERPVVGPLNTVSPKRVETTDEPDWTPPTVARSSK
jgi:hypothetical protein